MQLLSVYLVTCPDFAPGGYLVVASHSPGGAARLLQLNLRDQYADGVSVVPDGLTYLVRALSPNGLGSGLWLSGYDRSDDLEALLGEGYVGHVGPRLWGHQVEVIL
jgi:hypothetical protein